MGRVICTACGATCPEFDARCSSCQAPLPSVSSASRPGDLASLQPDDESLVGAELGRYRVEARIGVGAMGVVYRAIDAGLRRPVALKVLSRRLANDDRAKARMLREARATSQLDHPAIATVYEVGDHAGRPWIAMALYEGDTLKVDIAKGPMELRRVVRIGAELASGLAAAHGSGVVHRDVKPANVVVTAGGAVKILDFGLAKLGEGLDAGEGALLTRRGAVLGTVAYMAPEQLRGDQVDHRADLWALGVILYELAAGTLPFGATAERVAGEQLVLLSARRPEAPSTLDDLLAELLVREPAERLGSAEEVERRLRRIAADLGRATASTLDGSTKRTSVPSEASASIALGEGQVVADRFRLVRELGRGAMGAVWLAEHLGLGMRCAVKFIRDEHAELSDLRARFEREARSAALLKSRYVVQVLDHGVWSGRPYIAMDYLEGETLAERLSRTERLTLEETSRIVGQVAKGLGKAHAAGIVHRDLKPENVFLTTDEEGEVVKILDFGVAKAEWSGTAVGATQGGAVLGTPAYMSPEQANGSAAVDHRSDLWALGVIAFECITGRRPFDSEAIGELYVQILSKPIPVPSDVAGSVTRAFDRWWARAVEREPAARFQSARELAAALAETVHAPPDDAGEIADAAEPPDDSPAVSEKRERAGSSAWRAPAVAGALLVSGGVALAMLSGGGGARSAVLRSGAVATVSRTAEARLASARDAAAAIAPTAVTRSDYVPPPREPSAEPKASRAPSRTATAHVKPARTSRPAEEPPVAAPPAAPRGPDPSLFNRRD